MDCNLHIFTEIRENGIWKTFKDKSYPEFEFLNQKVEEIKKNDKEYIKFLFSDEYKSERMNLKLPSKKRAKWINTEKSDYLMFAILSDVRNSYPLLPFKKGTVIEEGWPSDFDPTDKNLNEEEYHYFTTYYVHEIDELKEHIFNLLFELEINSIEFDRLNEYIDKTLFTCP